jgi:hypothetical protein
MGTPEFCATLYCIAFQHGCTVGELGANHFDALHNSIAIPANVLEQRLDVTAGDPDPQPSQVADKISDSCLLAVYGMLNDFRTVVQ